MRKGRSLMQGLCIFSLRCIASGGCVLSASHNHTSGTPLFSASLSNNAPTQRQPSRPPASDSLSSSASRDFAAARVVCDGKSFPPRVVLWVVGRPRSSNPHARVPVTHTGLDLDRNNRKERPKGRDSIRTDARSFRNYWKSKRRERGLWLD